MGKVILEQKEYESMLNDFIQKELYKQRIDKAIEYLKNCGAEEELINYKTDVDVNGYELLKILRGEENEDN